MIFFFLQNLRCSITQATCGSYHTAAVTDTGELYTWGGGMYGKVREKGSLETM